MMARKRKTGPTKRVLRTGAQAAARAHTPAALSLAKHSLKSGSRGAKTSRSFVSELPNASSPSTTKLMVQLNQGLNAIRVGWLGAAEGGSGAVRQRRSSYLKTEVYRFACGAVAKHGIPALLRSLGFSDHEAFQSKKLFLALIRKVTTDDELSRAEQIRYANELAYARRHRVPVELVPGFILQVGAGKAIGKLVNQADHFQSWFDQSNPPAWSSSSE